jgi:DNA-binding winged helix-turn-helix (wHTH) protein
VPVTTRFGRFTLDDGARQVYRNGDAIHLSPKAFDLLALLVERRPDAISKSDLLDTLWPGTFVSEGNLAVLITEIRDALGDNARRPTFIRTVQRFGYAFSGSAAPGLNTAAATSCWLSWGMQRVALLVGENILGRDPEARVLIDVVGVSRRHAMIVVAGDEVTLHDLASKNGTFANDARITGSVRLLDDTEIRLGPVPILFRRLDHTVSTQTLDASQVSRSSR